MRRRRPTLALVSLAAASVLAAGLSAAPAAAAPGAPTLRALQAELRRGLAEIGAREEAPGMALAVRLPGERRGIAVTAGKRRLFGGGPVRPRSLSPAGAVTETLTAAAVLRLVAAGKLSLGARLSELLPEYPGWGGVRLRQLLGPTAGVPDYMTQPGFLMTVQLLPEHVWSAGDLVGLAYDAQPTVEGPRKGRGGSATGALLLQLIAERAGGAPLAAQARKLLRDAGLRDSFYVSAAVPERLQRRAAHGYHRAGVYTPDTDVTAYNLSWARGAGGLLSTAPDLARWMGELFAGDVLRRPDPRLLGARIARSGGLGPVWSKDGETFGYGAHVAWLPCLGTGLALLKSEADGEDRALAAARKLLTKALARSPAYRRLVRAEAPAGRSANCPAWASPRRRAAL